MKGDRYGGKRTNWLLIKHRDEYAKEGEGDDILEEDRSVASGRAMARSRKARASAKAVHVGQGKAEADAVWQSNRGDAAEARANGRRPHASHPGNEDAGAAPSARPKKGGRCRISWRRNSARSVERPPSGDGWCHEIKFDGYRVQMRVEDGEVALWTRKGLDWTDKFRRSRRKRRRFPTC